MFKPLTKSNIGKIVDLMVGELDKRLADQELSLELTDAAKDQVIENGYDPVYGARPLKRYLQKHVETLAARKILSGDVHAGDTLVLDVQNGGIHCYGKGRKLNDTQRSNDSAELCEYSAQGLL